MMNTSISRSVGSVTSPIRINTPISSAATAINRSAGFALASSASIDSNYVAISKSNATNGLGFDFDFSFNNIDHTQAEFNAYYADGAKKVSASQGLPEGQYDFTMITAQQLQIVTGDMIVNEGKTPDDVMGLQMVINDATWNGGINGTQATTPVNAISIISGQAKFEDSVGNDVAANFLRNTLSQIASFQNGKLATADIDIATLTGVLKEAASRMSVAR